MSASGVAARAELVELLGDLDATFIADCRALAAMDIFKLFHQKQDKRDAADIILERHPAALTTMIGAYFRQIDSESAIARTVSRGAAGAIREQTTWETIKLYFRRYSLVDSRPLDELRVPVFCAHSSNVAGATFDVEFSTATSREAKFTVGVPGLSGGFGVKGTVTLSDELKGQTLTVQCQAHLKALLNTWASPDKSVQLFSPYELLRTSACYENSTDYIRYDTRKKTTPLEAPFDCKIDGARQGYEIVKDAADEFGFDCAPIAGLSGKITVKSAVAQKMKVTHELKRGYRYEWQGLGGKCHDIFISATRL